MGRTLLLCGCGRECERATKGGERAQPGYSLCMGRARSQSVDGFNAIFGNARGSALAQAERDHAEIAARKVAFEQERASVFLLFSQSFLGLKWGAGGGVSCEEFIQAYVNETQKELEVVLLRRLRDPGWTLAFRSVSQIVDFGKPTLVGPADATYTLFQDLTAPALVVLNTRFQELIEQARADASQRHMLANMMIISLSTCFSFQDESRHFSRLRGLCETLATALMVASEDSDSVAASQPAKGAAEKMALILESAPVEVVENELSPWVKTFAERHDAGLSDHKELEVLTRIAKSCEADLRRQRAFEKLCPRL